MTQTKIKAKRSSSRIFGVGTGRVREEVGVLDEGVVGKEGEGIERSFNQICKRS